MDRASPHNCASCSKPLGGAGDAGYLAGHVCPGCGQPQALARGEDYFAAFGLPRRFAIDRALLEKRFYEISRALHPDRFTAAGPDARARSLERMSFINEAYRTLKDPGALRQYLLAREGLELPAEKEGARGQIPMELAESWFELQDALAEDPAHAREKLSEFERGLRDARERAGDRFAELERGIDAALERGEPAPRDLLEQLAREIRAQSYLKSMERDVERIRQRFEGKAS